MKKDIEPIDRNDLLQDLTQLIEEAQVKVVVQSNHLLILLFWRVGKRINEEILQNKRADYGAQIVSTVSTQLKSRFGRNFELRNLRRMMQFAEQFQDPEIIISFAGRLSWSHFLELLPLKEMEAKIFYAHNAANNVLGVRELRRQISTKVFERTMIANLQISSLDSQVSNTFKDPYFLDFLGLQNTFLEKDLEAAILRDLESFILELGKGFTFVERQKRMIIDGEDFYLDLLFYHRKLKRLVAIELKLGKFEAAHKGQMELYLKWLDRYDKQEDENQPIGLILCAESSREQIELLEMHKDGIMVAEYWTELPPKHELEQKIHSLLLEARERIARNRLLK